MSRPVFVFLLALAAGAGARASEEDVVFRSDVSLVRVDAQVVDRDNRAITGMRLEDFILREEGRPQPIRNFASENMPVDLLLLLDVSASMRPHVERIANAAHEAMRVLGKDDRVGIMVFDRYTRVRLPFRNSREAVEREFENLLRQETFNGGTDITRGLLDAAEYIGRNGRRDARRAIVILTDDATERNRDEEAVSRALTRADAVLSALIAPDAMRSMRRQGPYGGNGGGGGYPGGGGGGMGGPLGGIILGRPRYPSGGGYPRGGGNRGPHTQSAGTSEIARRSGGDSMPVDDAYAFENTIARLRQRYALYFYLPPGVKAGQDRTIEVALADSAMRRYSGAEVRYRRTYLAPADSGQGTPAPTVISQAPARSDDTPPVLRRRPAVDGPIGGAGPTIGSAPSSDGAWRKTEQPPAAAAPPPAEQPPSNTGGWRKVKPDEQE